MEKGAHNVLATLGTKDGINPDRQKDDFYATDPKATKMVLEELKKIMIFLFGTYGNRRPEWVIFQIR